MADAEFKSMSVDLQNPCSPSLGRTISGSQESEQGDLERPREGDITVPEGLDTGDKKAFAYKRKMAKNILGTKTFFKMCACKGW